MITIIMIIIMIIINPEFVLENEMNNVLGEFEIQKDHLIAVRWPDLVIVNKNRENLPCSGLCYPGERQNKNKRKWKKS